MTIRLTAKEFDPQVDYYHTNTGGVTTSHFYVDLETGEYGVTQECDDNSTPGREWHGLVQTSPIDNADAEDGSAYLESKECKTLVKKVVDNSESVWDGSNFKGSMNADARMAFAELVEGLNGLRPNRYTLQSCSEYFGDRTNEDLGISAETSDEEIAALSASFKKDADIMSDTLLSDSVADYLIDCRESLRSA
jgi:hypothetical protein